MLTQEEVKNRLETQLEAAQTPEERIDLLNRLGFFYRFNHLATTRSYAEQAYELAVKQDYIRGTAEALVNLSFTERIHGETEQSLTHLLKAIELARRCDVRSALADGLGQLGIHLGDAGNLPEALETGLAAVHIAEKLGDAFFLASTFNQLSIIYILFDDYEKALASLQECQQHIQRYPSELPVTITYAVRHNIALCYLRLKRYAEALAYAQDNLIWFREIDGLHGQSFSLSIIGQVHLALGRPDEALQCFQAILNLPPERQNRDTEIKTYINIGHHYLQRTELDKALAALHKAKTLLDQTPINHYIIEVCTLLSSTYRQLGDFEKALQYHEQYHESEKKAFNTRSAHMQLIYETDKAEKEKTIYQLRNEALQRELEERKRTEAERLERDRLLIALEKEQELNLMKTRIMDRLSHELRTPLTIIQVKVDLLTRYTDRLTEEKRLAHKNVIFEQVTHLMGILDDIVSILRGPDDRQNFDPQEVVLGEVLRQIIARLRLQIDRPERLVAEVDIENSVMNLDTSLLECVLKELIANALKFSPMDALVTVKASFNDTNLMLSVTDQGIGILKSEQEKIFRPFFRGSNIDETPGVGLGLSLVETWIHMHRGRIGIESQVGQGTTVTCHFNKNGASSGDQI